jgi:hypothetical protein
MTEVNVPSRQTSPLQFIAIVAAGAMLNIGLYFVLFFFTPLLSGLVVGFVLRKLRNGAVAGFISSFAAFTPFLLYLSQGLLVLNPTSDLVSFYLAVMTYVFLLSLAGSVCGVLGGAIGRRASSNASRVDD